MYFDSLVFMEKSFGKSMSYIVLLRERKYILIYCFEVVEAMDTLVEGVFTLNFSFSFRGVFRILWSIYSRGFLRKLLGSTKLCYHSRPSTTSHHFVVTTNDHPRPAISSFPTPTTTYYIATTKQYIRQTIILTTTMRKQSWFRHYHRALHLWCCSSPRSASV